MSTPSCRPDPEPLVDRLGGRAPAPPSPRGCGGTLRPAAISPASLARNELTPSQAIDHLGPQFGAVPVGAHADHPPAGVPDQPGGHRRGEQPGPGPGRLAGQPRVEVRPQGGHAVERGRTPGLGPVVDRTATGSRSSSSSSDGPPSAPPGPPPTSRGRWRRAPARRPRRRRRSSSRGTGPRSTRTTDRPARASARAAADPAGPAPTTTASKIGIVRHRGRGVLPAVAPAPLGDRLGGRAARRSAGPARPAAPGVGDQAEVGHGRHRATRRRC